MQVLEGIFFLIKRKLVDRIKKESASVRLSNFFHLFTLYSLCILLYYKDTNLLLTQ